LAAFYAAQQQMFWPNADDLKIVNTMNEGVMDEETAKLFEQQVEIFKKFKNNFLNIFLDS